ncbi:putative nucleotidyl transferase [Acinetobacter phage BS46]|nr:putative nucleotidyl transferase [Acinetobacter phage BS46]
MSKFKENVGSIVMPSEWSSEMQGTILTYIELFYNRGYNAGYEDGVKDITGHNEDEE